MDPRIKSGGDDGGCGLLTQPEKRPFIFNDRVHRDHRVEIILCELCVLCGEHFNVVLAFCGKFWYIFLSLERGSGMGFGGVSRLSNIADFVQKTGVLHGKNAPVFVQNKKLVI
ncbi:MAG: hypothetical protein NUV50_11610 [Rhodospirillales bacterium]|nr:hypothetical protein [Rhodospirillales bacterium]